MMLSMISVIWSLLLFQKHVLATNYHHDVYPQPRNIEDSSTNNESSSAEFDTPQAMVARAQIALKSANKKRIENVHFNNYTFRYALTVPVIAPPLDYNSTSAQNISMRRSNKLATNNSSDANSTGYTYSIPAELIQAAKVVADSEETLSQAMNHSTIMANLVTKYGLRGNDTNRMPQATRNPDGLFRYVARGMGEQSYEIVSNETSALVSRAASTFWMANMAQNGQSPYVSKPFAANC